MEDKLIQQIKESSDIVEVIGSYIPLIKKGSAIMARCPFHEEKTPSFRINENGQYFKCFGCGKGGNVITFVRDYEHITFMEAVEKLAERAGISIKSTPKNSKKSKTEILMNVYGLAKDFFVNNLQFEPKVLEYLNGRGLSLETTKKFEIGYALDSFNGLQNHLRRNNIKADVLAVSGLFGQKNDRLYDIFRNRIMFPIHSLNGKIVAFGGRVLSKNQGGGKYINSPTTDIYHKGDQLYGLHLTKYEISKKKFVIISEGYLDFLRLYENGFTNSVASLGTSLTEKQVRLLSRYTEEFVILYDGDNAGQKAAVRAASIIIKEGYAGKIAILPEGEDPDSFLLKQTNIDLEKIIKNALPLIEFVKQDKKQFSTQRKKIDFLMEIVKENSDLLSKDLMIKSIAEMFNISENSLYSVLEKKHHGLIKKHNIPLNDHSEERTLLELIINSPNLIKNVAEKVEPDYFLNEIYKKLFKEILEIIETHDIGSVNEWFDLQDVNKNIIDKIAEFITNKSRTEVINEIISSLYVRKIKLDIKNINNKIMLFGDNIEMFKALIKKKEDLKNQLNEIIDSPSTQFIAKRGLNE
jgi:DNA primase